VTEVATAEVTAFPTVSGSSAIASAAQQKGVMVAEVSGLIPDTEYCAQPFTTSVPSGQVWAGPMLRVRTEKRTLRGRSQTPNSPLASFSNDLVRIEIQRPDTQLSTAGALVLVKIKDASSPLSGFVGDAIDDDADPSTPSGLALINLDNLYLAATGESFDLKGDGTEDIATRVLGGPQGFVAVQARLVPPEHGLSEAVSPSPCRDAGVIQCDGRLGDSDANGAIEIADANAIQSVVVGQSPTVACPVCADAYWDLSLDMPDALAIAQSVSGWRVLPW
jgi:hypothetical protein